jgi:hypothetical protein
MVLRCGAPSNLRVVRELSGEDRWQAHAPCGLDNGKPWGIPRVQSQFQELVCRQLERRPQDDYLVFP